MSLFSDGLLQLDPWIDETEDIVIEEEQPKARRRPNSEEVADSKRQDKAKTKEKK